MIETCESSCVRVYFTMAIFRLMLPKPSRSSRRDTTCKIVATAVVRETSSM